MTTKSEIEAVLPAGYSTYYKPARRGAIGMVGQWIIVGRLGESAPAASVEQVPAAIARIEAALNRPAPTPTVPVEAPTPVAPHPAPRARRCDHETDNRGICYSCGAYVRADDAGGTLRRYGIVR